MENEFRKSSGICLITGSLLASTAMAIHPLGGNMAEMVRIKNVMFLSHSLAIFCVPFIAFGFWGLSTQLATKSRISFLAFAIICFGLVAVMIAGTINGLVMPGFASKHIDSTIDRSFLEAIISYGRFINLSNDYIFISALSLSVLIWSGIVLFTKKLSTWLGYYGLLLITFTIGALSLKLNFTSVFGFSLFIFGIVTWMLIAGILLIIKSKQLQSYE